MAPRSTPYLILLTLMWGALSFHWTILGNNILPTRVLEFSTPETKGRMLALATVAGAFVAMVTGPIAGLLSDESRWRFGRRRPYLAVGTVLNCAALFWLIGAQTFGGFLAAVLAVQLFANFAGAPYTAMIPDQVPDLQKGKATGFAGFSEVVGRLVGAILGGLLITMPAATAVLAPLLWFLPNSLRLQPMLPITLLIAFVIAASMAVTLWWVHEEPADGGPERPPHSFLRRAFLFDIRAERDFAWLLASRAMNMLAINTLTTFLLYYVHDYLGVADIGEANAKLGYLFAVSAITTLPSSLIVGYIIDRTQRRKVWIYASGFGLALVSVAFISIERFSGALAIGAAFGLCYGAYFTSDWSLALALLPKDGTAAKYMGIWGIAGTAPQVLAPGIGGIVLDQFNALGPNVGYTALFTAIVVYLVIGTTMLMKVVEPPASVELPFPSEKSLSSDPAAR